VVTFVVPFEVGDQVTSTTKPDGWVGTVIRDPGLPGKDSVVLVQGPVGQGNQWMHRQNLTRVTPEPAPFKAGDRIVYALGGRTFQATVVGNSCGPLVLIRRDGYSGNLMAPAERLTPVPEPTGPQPGDLFTRTYDTQYGDGSIYRYIGKDGLDDSVVLVQVDADGYRKSDPQCWGALTFQHQFAPYEPPQPLITDDVTIYQAGLDGHWGSAYKTSSGNHVAITLHPDHTWSEA
jgi:hypothetical protein